MPDDLPDPLPREELLRLLGAVRAVARASGPLEYERVLAAVLDAFVEALPVDRAAIYLLDEPNRRLVLAGDYPRTPEIAALFPYVPLDGSITGKHVKSLRPGTYAVTEIGPTGTHLATHGIQSVGMVPLHVKERAYGCLQLARAGGLLSEGELRAAETLGELLVVYLENARLYTDAHKRLEETRTLLEVGRAVTASSETAERLRALTELLARIVDATNVWILWLEDDDRYLQCVACSNPRWADDVRTVRLPMSNPASSVAVRCVHSRAPVIVEDAQSSRAVRRELVERHGSQSILALPLLVRDQPIGAVLIDDTRTKRQWSAEEIERAEVVVHQVALAVANVRLFDELKRSYDELARTQAELVKRERLAALGQLAATLAHEVRNPLGVLLNSISTLGKALPPNGDFATLLTIMDEEVQRLERLVRELLDFVRPLTPTLESESLHALAESAIEAAALELGASAGSLANEVPHDLAPIRLDARMIRRALLNLIVNGAQAAGAAGRVVVRAAREPRAGRPFVRVEVIDSGPGIPAHVAPRVFEPFFTTKATGTGLGLAVVKEIAEAHAGEIEVSSDTRWGTTIALLLPADRGDAG